MRFNKRLITTTCALSVAALLGTTALADEKGVWCEKGDSDCKTLTIDTNGDSNVFFVGEGDDKGEGMHIRMPRLNFAFGAFGGGGYMGVSLVSLTDALREHFGVPDDAGVLIGGVEDESPALEAGIEVGDIVTAVDGEEVESAADLSRLVREHEEGDAVEVELYRDGRPLTLDVTVGERARPQLNAGKWTFLHGENEDGDGDHPRRYMLDIDPDAFKESMIQFKKFQTFWNSDDAGNRVGRFGRMESDLQEKIEALEERIHQLEEQLDDR